jgi:L-amino acid N-acyltransferase YncA
MQRLIKIASERGVRRLTGAILRENTPMIALVRKLGFEVQETSDEGVVRGVRDLAKDPQASGESEAG